MQAWGADSAHLAARGLVLLDAKSYIPDEFRHDFALAMDAQPALATSANAGIPAYLTMFVDPEQVKILFSPTNAAKIIGEMKKGTWLDETAIFTVIEHTGEVTSYGDYAEGGSSGVNTNFPQRQSYLFQTMKRYGERELERAGLARLNYVSEIDVAASMSLNRLANLSYFFGIDGLQNYGLINDPNLSAAITPATKSNGGTGWFTTGGGVNATANEVYNDIVAMFKLLVDQSGGNLDKEASCVLAMSPDSALALQFTNTFNVNVEDLLKKNFKNLRLQTAVQYGATSATNPQGVAAGNLVQLIAENVEGQKTGTCAFNEKMRSHPIIRATSSFQQKATAGTFGAVIKQPFAFAQMVGV
jgi:hypothetical protein